MDGITFIVKQKAFWNWQIAFYLFAGGMAGGAFIVSGVADLLARGDERLNLLAKVSAYLSVPIGFAGALALLLHLKRPFVGFFFPLYFSNLGSWIGGGAYVMFISMNIMLAVATLHYLGRMEGLRKVLSAINIPGSIGLIIYTGFLISGTRFHHMWPIQYIPIIFVVSGVSTGIAASAFGYLAAAKLVGGERAGDVKHTSVQLGYFDDAVIVLEVIVIFFFLKFLSGGNPGEQQAYEILTSGSLGTWFWWGFIAIGIVFPLASSVFGLVTRREVTGILYVRFLGVIFGGAVLRFVLVFGGNLKTLVFPAIPPSGPPIF